MFDATRRRRTYTQHKTTHRNANRGNCAHAELIEMRACTRINRNDPHLHGRARRAQCTSPTAITIICMEWNGMEEADASAVTASLNITIKFNNNIFPPCDTRRLT